MAGAKLVSYSPRQKRRGGERLRGAVGIQPTLPYHMRCAILASLSVFDFLPRQAGEARRGQGPPEAASRKLRVITFRSFRGGLRGLVAMRADVARTGGAHGMRGLCFITVQRRLIQPKRMLPCVSTLKTSLRSDLPTLFENIYISVT